MMNFGDKFKKNGIQYLWKHAKNLLKAWEGGLKRIMTQKRKKRY